MRLSLFFFLAFAVTTASAGALPSSRNRLALLIASPQNGEKAMHNDLVAMREALLARGFRRDEILELEGELDRPRVVAFLAAASRRTASWESGGVFLHYTGHGSLTSSDPATAEAVLQLRGFPTPQAPPANQISWAEVFRTLAVPKGVGIFVVPDS